MKTTFIHSENFVNALVQIKRSEIQYNLWEMYRDGSIMYDHFKTQFLALSNRSDFELEFLNQWLDKNELNFSTGSNSMKDAILDFEIDSVDGIYGEEIAILEKALYDLLAKYK
jgi:hypothetical protein